ncbi:hypothetical protein OSB04_013725 [Centaurea solstitialis]|uniref:UspA domain-containing protein n=1 Tax=Centaurea solstitialis TaxID=347529 RepID=A0AA38TRR5_9ASTR|nr:hypothetical protein OSB04_013725 [Centaurea solstitialis]
MENANAREETMAEKDTKTVNGGTETAEEKSGMKIWIAVDESDGSFYALEWALEHLFHLPHHAAAATTDKDPPFSVTVVHIQPPYQPAYTALPVGPVLFATPGMKESVLKAEEESGAKVKAEYLVLKGKPKEILVEAVEQMDVDLLVVGSRGLGHIKRAVLGSISDYCAHHAKCPVLIVRPQKAD